uniref:histone H1-like n=1 Tax=Pristiophorus japonicus TaxID=55135 RepID=UPI00398E315F
MADTLRDRSTRKKRTRAPSSARRSVSQRILEAVATTRERRGLSLAALKKVLSAGGYDAERNNWRVNKAVRSMVTKGSLLQATGTGASGSFRLGKMQGDQPHPAAGEQQQREEKPNRVAAARERGKRKRQRAARQPARKAAPRGRGSPRKIKKGAAARKGARRVAARKPRGKSGLGAKGKRQRTRPRKLAKRPELEADQPPGAQEISHSEKESQVCLE